MVETSKNKKSLVASALTNKINEVMRRNGHTRRDLQRVLDVSFVHVNSLMGGVRSFAGLNIEKQRAMAKYLGISFAQYYIYLGILEPSDFMVEESFDQRVKLTFDKMRQDPMWSATALSQTEVDELPDKAKILIALLYERVSHESLLDKIDIPDISGRKKVKKKLS